MKAIIVGAMQADAEEVYEKGVRMQRIENQLCKLSST